jgi:hypothetical protein
VTVDMSMNTGQVPAGQGWSRRTVEGGPALWLPDAVDAQEDRPPVQPTPVRRARRERTPRPWDTWPASVRLAAAGTVGVMVACWTVSFDAIVAGAQAASIPFLFALLCPLIVDGEMAIGTLALVSIARRVKRRTRVYLGVLILASVAVSMAANMAGPYTRTHMLSAPWSYLAAGVPSLWIALIVHQLVILWRHTHDRTGEGVQPAPVTVTVMAVPDSWLGVRSPDGRWWWDGVRWCPVPMPIEADTEPQEPVRPTVVPQPDEPVDRPADTERPPRREVDTDRPVDASVAARVDALAAYLRSQVDAGRDVSAVGVSELSRETGIPRPTVYRLLPDALSTFRLGPAVSGQEVAA